MTCQSPTGTSGIRSTRKTQSPGNGNGRRPCRRNRVTRGRACAFPRRSGQLAGPRPRCRAGSSRGRGIRTGPPTTAAPKWVSSSANDNQTSMGYLSHQSRLKGRSRYKLERRSLVAGRAGGPYAGDRQAAPDRTRRRRPHRDRAERYAARDATSVVGNHRRRRNREQRCGPSAGLRHTGGSGPQSVGGAAFADSPSSWRSPARQRRHPIARLNVEAGATFESDCVAGVLYVC